MKKKFHLFFSRFSQNVYLVKWKNYPHTECTWEPERNFPYKNVLREYFIRYEHKQKLKMVINVNLNLK